MPTRMPRGPNAPAAEAIGWNWSPAAPLRWAPGPTARARALTLAVLALGACGALALALGFLAFVARLDRAERLPRAPADGIVVLTGGAQRIEDAIDLLAQGFGRRLLISGVNERTSRDEIARLNPTQQHLISCCVDLDYRARNTIGNAIETRRWMRENGFRSVAVVTSNYHMPRTLVELDHALAEGHEIVPHPVVTDGLDAARWWRHPSTARLLAFEYVKFLVAWTRTRFEGDPERSHAAVLMGRGKPVKLVAEPLIR
jgi:uncharacterized SAM-binding protein YcdF (DUF218 family)